MTQDSDIYLWAQVIIVLIILICFFIMGSNIGKLKRSLAKNQQQHWEDFIKYKSFGNLQEANKSLNEYMWIKLRDIQMKTLILEQRITRYEALKKEYEPFYQSIGAEFPAMV